MLFRSRMDAVEDLLDAVHATCRMGPDGALEVVPVGGVSTPVWTIAGGDAGVLVDLRRSLSDEGVFNAAVSEGETPAGLPLIGRAYVPAGPLEWGGPFGRVPVFHNAVAQTQAGVTADASTLLSNRIAAGEVDLAVACLTHPGVQLHDPVVVVAATTAGDAALVGRVVRMRMSSAGSIPAKSMTLSVRVKVDDLEAVAARVAADRRG